jgi:hypothetical protein
MQKLNLNIPFMKNWIPLLLVLLFCISCENEQESSASIEFKTGIGYTSQDATISKGSSITVGILADKTENNLKAYNVSVSYDGALNTITIQNFTISSDENTPYDKDVNFTVRNQTGKEKYYFTVIDVDGNLVQKMLTFTVE